ncbi:MAG: hypothetical protein EAX89_05250 [Candidatus Lokiarchaeota archaeon]|nr:hypothetical protein [Candidatus Lokiarchaeota archaeon]
MLLQEKNRKRIKITGNNRKKCIIPLLYCCVMIIFIIGSFIVNLPVPFLISVYALTISTITVQYNHFILNSLTKPLTFIYLFAFLQDIYDLNFFFAAFHIGTVISCFYILKRKETSLILMIIMSFIYALWIYVIKIYLHFPFYECVFFICKSVSQSIIVLFTGILTSLLVSLKKVKNLWRH